MGNNNLKSLEFDIKGKFLTFLNNESGKLKHLQLEIGGIPSQNTASGDIKIELPKRLRTSLVSSLKPGQEIRVIGTSQSSPDTGKIRLKAKLLIPIDESFQSCSRQETTSDNKIKLLVCQKPGCLKRGGENLLSQIEQTIIESGLQNRVVVKGTGCLKRCSKAPNCVLKLGKNKYNRIHPHNIASFLEKHVS
ncbi:MAG: (2Fe-2S) ferredoxin domain-containing protein [Cyanobacteria bacterium P01_A01_bin.45]